MGSLRERFNAARQALFPAQNSDQDGDPLLVEMIDEEDEDNEGPDSGPLPMPALPHRPAPSLRGGAVAQISHFEQQRALIDSFDEDYADRWDKVKLFVAKWVAIALPVIAVLAIGDELGRYFAQFAGGSWAQSWIAYGGEAALAALTYMLGTLVGRAEKSVGFFVKASVTFLIWLAFIAASAWGQWAVAQAALPPNASEGLVIAIWLRIGMACMLDAASVAIMFWRGKSLTKFLAQMQQKADATIRVNEAELTINRAQSAAAQREKEDALYLKGKEQAQDVVMRVQELQGEALIEQARAALQLPEQSSSRNGRQLRGW